MAGNGAACAAPAGAVHVLGGATMGTLWQASVVAAAGADGHALHDGIQACLDRVVAQMSTWEHGSDISRYNRAPAGTWQALPQPFFDVLREALAIAADTGGAVDPTIGPLVEAWGFGPGGQGGRPPDPDARADARARVGWTRVELDQAAQRALQPGGVGLDLSGIAKGHGVDAVVQWLRARGVSAALVEVGGELRGYGRKPDGSAWRVLAEAWPEDADGDAGATDEDGAQAAAADAGTGTGTGIGTVEDAAGPCIVVLDDAAIATSGDHWHCFEHGGRRYSHTIDPRSGAPVDHAPGAVTVVADSALQADAWATALTVLGPIDGLALAQARGIAARWVTRGAGGERAHASDAFLQRLAP
ncbi:FAD:protein FMN transferase [Luteimonas sp. MC1895]|uniref:FAD:protein FMN transferase n=1 Tax=Luteimonas sp. MC1895 TaxID=2819513 RepID=UPI0018F05DC8|nr:FAD:protein FMN transferase [Luteimonas sp. MC1895]MBJ6978719.1 FAD:protein FMN transferase [Luteimonas sp. MC1895]